MVGYVTHANVSWKTRSNSFIYLSCKAADFTIVNSSGGRFAETPAESLFQVRDAAQRIALTTATVSVPNDAYLETVTSVSACPLPILKIIGSCLYRKVHLARNLQRQSVHALNRALVGLI